MMGSLKRKSLLIMFVLYLEDWIHWYFLLLLIQLVWFIIFVLSIYQSCSIFLTSLLLFSLELAIFSHFTFWNLLSINLTLFFNILLQSILKFNFNTAPSSRTKRLPDKKSWTPQWMERTKLADTGVNLKCCPYQWQ